MITALAPRRSVVRPLMVPLTGGRPCSILCPWWLQFSAVSRFLSLVFYCICSSFLALPRLVSWWSWHDTNIWPVPTCGQPPVLPVSRVRLGQEEAQCRLFPVRLLHVDVGHLKCECQASQSHHSNNLLALGLGGVSPGFFSCSGSNLRWSWDWAWDWAPGNITSGMSMAAVWSTRERIN